MIFSGPITNVETNDPVAALTFDDGPHPVYTPGVLSILEKHGAKATFFMLGETARKYPEIVKMVASAGHVIGNHSWNHTNLTKIKSRVHRLKQMWECARATAPYCKRFFRPPYGGISNQIRLDALFFRYKIILWSASAQDWIPQGPEEIAQKIIERIKPGSIFLLHDAIYDKKTLETIENREAMIDGLKIALSVLKQKINFITVPELLQVGRPVYNWPLN
ncbi:MAG: polysaccharide deacetylase family protein [bacterium]